MKKRKMLSAALATALVVAQMGMPVMAAEGGTVEVDTTTKTGVVRVEVPLVFAVAVDQFEMGTSGVQINTPTEFKISNKSELNIKAEIETTVTLGNATDYTLLATKAEATDEDAEAKSAWLAVAAKMGSSYDDPKTASDTEGLADLTEENFNVATFVQGEDTDANKGVATQIFYLAKSTGTKAYNLAKPSTAGKAPLAYGRFYKLTDITSTVTSGTATAAEVAAKAADNDLYFLADGTDPANGAALTFIPKGTEATDSLLTGITFAAANKFYTAADGVTEVASLATTDLYVCPTMSAAGGEAEFQYIGNLSQNTEEWTKADIKKYDIKYSFTGATTSKYAAIVADTDNYANGLYNKPAATFKYTSGKDNTNVVLTLSGKTLATDYLSINGVVVSGFGSFSTNATIDASAGTVTIKPAFFSATAVANATTNHKYTFIVKDTDGTEWKVENVDLTPAP